MTNEPVVLAIGCDFARVEAALVDATGAVIQRENAPFRTTSTGELTYLEPAQLLDAVFRAVVRVLGLKPREARRIAAVSLIGRSPTATYVAAHGREAPFVVSRDGRFVSAQNAFKGDFEEICARVGLTRDRCQIPFAVAGASPRPDAKLLTPKDYVKWVLTGEFTTDPLDAQYTFLWDLENRRWSDDLCRSFGIDGRSLPVVTESTAVAGHVTSQAARATGLPEGLPVACGLGDWGEYLGSGAYELRDVFEHIGSTGALYGVTDSRPGDALRFDVRPHVVAGKYLVGRQGLPGGACLDWFLRKTSLTRAGEIDWVQVEAELEAAAAMGRPESVLFFPNLAGREEQVAGAAFLNLGIADDLTAFIQGIMEGLFFTLKAVAEEIKTLGCEPKTIFTTGQIAFKHAPRRIRASIYGVPIRAGRTPGANVTAAALVGAVAGGVYASLEQARSKMLNLDGGAVPDRATSALYEAHFASWMGTRNFLAPGGR